MNEMSYSMVDVWKYYYNNFKRDKELFVFLLMVIHGFASGILPLVSVVLSKFIIDSIGAGNLEDTIFYIALFGGSSFILSSIAVYLRGAVQGRFLASRVRKATEIGSLFRDIEFKYLEDADFHKKRNEAQSTFRRGNEGYQGALELVLSAFPELISVIGFIYILGIFNPWIIVISLVAAVIQFKLAMKAKKYTLSRHLERTDYERKSQYFYNVSHDYGYAKDIRINQLSRPLSKKYQEQADGVLGIRKKVFGYERNMTLFDVLFLLATNGVTYYLVIQAYFDGTVTLGTIAMTIMTVLGITVKLQNLFKWSANIKEETEKTKKYMAFAAQDCFYETIDSKGDKVDFPEMSIVFQDVSFSYPNSDTLVLDGVSFAIDNLTKLALVGINGAGKTTIVKLIAGLYLPTKGDIYINGHNTKDLNRTHLRQQLSIVFQDVNIYAATVLENITGLNPTKEDRLRAIENLEKVNLLEKVNSFSEQENQILLKSLDPKGIELSGGESQKLSIARALYKQNTKLIILDEPTASLDAIAEKEIYEKFNELVQNRTAIMISHRLASTRFCDNILFLEDGKVKEEGSHEELMNIEDGEYRNMFITQGKYYKQGSDQ